MEFEDLDDLYREVILDHYKRPRNNQLLQNPSLKAEGYNPFCGDQVILTAEVGDSERIEEVGFTGQGCAISQASASMMTGLLKGKTLEEVGALSALFRGMMHGESPDHEELGDLEALEGVKMYPIRIKCALLPWSTLEEAIEEYQRNG